MTRSHELRINNGAWAEMHVDAEGVATLHEGGYLEIHYARGERGRASALTDAMRYMDAHAPKKEGAHVSVIEHSAGSFTLMRWTAMVNVGASNAPLVWVLDTAAGLRHDEDKMLGFDWRDQRDLRIALGGEW